jgi:MSHA biogenesis protein MshQ
VTLSGGKMPLLTPLVLSAPGTGNSGSVDLTLNLTDTVSGNTCLSATASAATAANMAAWFGANPTARATFGVFKSPLVYRRENY